MTIPGQLRKIYWRRFEQRAREPAPSELSRSAIVLAPHQDDETLACGGMIAKKRRAGAQVAVVFMTDGRTSHAHLMPAEELTRMRRQEAVAACQRLGVESQDVIFLDFPDGDLQDHLAAAADRLQTILLDRRPDEIYVPHICEPPADHAATYRAMERALQEYPAPITVIAYPVWLWDHWPWTSPLRAGRRATVDALHRTITARWGLRILHLFPDVIHIGDVLADKRAALAAHRSQMERLRPETGWPILADVSNGEFLNCFAQPFELFQRHEIEPNHKTAPLVVNPMTRKVQ